MPYQAQNLQGIGLAGKILTAWNFSGQNLINAQLAGTTLTNANLTGATVAGADFNYSNLTASQLYSTAGYQAQNLQGIGLAGKILTAWNFSGQNLTNAQLGGTTLTSANLSGATVAGASFGQSNLTAAQLYSTASYQAQNLQGITLYYNDLTGWNFLGQNLTNADLAATLTNANLAGATVAGANFSGSNLTASQLYSTASYQAQNLQGIVLNGNNLTGWNFSGQNLTSAYLPATTLTIANLTNANLANAHLDSATLTNANLTGADLRGAQQAYLVAAVTTNTILPDGTLQGLHLDSNNSAIPVRNYSGNIPIHILQGMSMNSGTSLVFQFDGAPWGSTISFDSGIPVALGGNIELGLVARVDPASLLGDSFHLFDWSSVSPSGQFANVINDLPAGFLWNTTQLYTTGYVTLVPGPSTWKGPGGGSFNLASNWVNNNVPNGVDATANFSGNITAPSMVTLDSLVTLGTLTFNSPQAYTIAGASSLMLQASSGTAIIDVQNGSHGIGVPVVINSDTVISGPGTLDLSGGISGAHTLTVLSDLIASSIQVDTLTIGTTGTMAVPEPSTLVLLGIAISLAYAWRRSRIAV